MDNLTLNKANGKSFKLWQTEIFSVKTSPQASNIGSLYIHQNLLFCIGFAWEQNWNELKQFAYQNYMIRLNYIFAEVLAQNFYRVHCNVLTHTFREAWLIDRWMRFGWDGV